MIKSSKVFKPREYLKYVRIEIKDDEPMGDIPLNYIIRVLKENGKPYWDYPLDFYNNIQNQDPDIVLVDCSYYDGERFVQEYRWFEVGLGF